MSIECLVLKQYINKCDTSWGVSNDCGCLTWVFYTTHDLLRNVHAPWFIGHTLDIWDWVTSWCSYFIAKKKKKDILVLLPKWVHWPSKCRTLQNQFELTSPSQHPLMQAEMMINSILITSSTIMPLLENPFNHTQKKNLDILQHVL